MKLIPNFFTSLFIDETYTYTCLLDYSLSHVRLSLFYALVFILSLVNFIFYPGVHPEVDKRIDTGMFTHKHVHLYIYTYSYTYILHIYMLH